MVPQRQRTHPRQTSHSRTGRPAVLLVPHRNDVPNDHCYWFVCFAPLEANVPQILGFEEFLTGLALMVLAWTIADPVYRFRIKTAPIPLIEITFGIATVIGVLTLLTDVWRAERWFVPVGNLLTPASWQAVLGGVFVLTFLTWGWFAVIRPARFGRHNAERYAKALYGAILQGSSSELPVVAQELIRSAKSLIHHATDIRVWEAERRRQGEGKAQTLPRVTKLANDILLLIGHPRFCRAVVEAAPAAAWAVFGEIADAKKYGVQIGVFARNILNEALANKNSFLFHETDGYQSGLIGIHQPLSQAMFGNHEMVAAIPLMLDIDWKARSRWDEEQWTAYCRVVLITLRSYLNQGHRGQSSVLYSAMRIIEEATGDLHTLNGTAVGWSGAESLDRLGAVVQFIRDAIEMLEEREVPAYIKLPINETRQRWTIYDDIAEMIKKVVQNAAYVRQPTELCWSVQYASV